MLQYIILVSWGVNAEGQNWFEGFRVNLLTSARKNWLIVLVHTGESSFVMISDKCKKELRIIVLCKANGTINLQPSKHPYSNHF